MMRNDLPAPPRHSGAALPLISLDYLIALSPILIANLLRNGPRTLVMVLLSALVAAATEALCEALLRRRITVWDGSAAIDGVILALLLPATAPLWTVLLLALCMTVVFKVLWGGQGKCPVHPALGAYALLFPFLRFLLQSYPAADRILPPFAASVPGDGSETVLDQLMRGVYPADRMTNALLRGELLDVMGGLFPLLLLLSLVYLVARRRVQAVQPLFTVMPLFILALVLPRTSMPSDTMAVSYAALQALSGSLLFLAVIPASHPAYAPRTYRGKAVFGIGVGVIVWLIRYFGILSDGAVYGVVAMQLLIPLLDRAFRARHYGQD